jgi:hypothetical protein
VRERGLMGVARVLFVAVIVFTGCTATQKAALRADEIVVQADLHGAASTALGLVAAAEQNPALTQEALSLVQSVVAKPGATPPQAFLDAQAALSQGNLARAHTALATVVAVTAPTPAVK